MRSLLFFFVFSLSLFGDAVGQDLSNYQYVRVPQEYEFLKHENQYQLNALTAFLLEKYNFEALYDEQTPEGVAHCEVLEANVHNESGLFRSRLYVTLEDCNDRVLFTSQTGVSREKDFEKSYHEALREAFKSFEGLRKKPEVVIDPVPTKEVAAQNTEPAEVIVDPVPAPEDVQEKAEIAEVIVDPGMNPAVEPGRVYVNGNLEYNLKPTSVGFELYKEGEEDKFATLLKSGGGENFLYSSKNISGNAFFDTQGNLVVEYLDPNSQQLVTVTYKSKD